MHIEIEGRVQGVGFRWFARQCAERNGITGWATNRPDGCVEVVARGEAEALKRFRMELNAGPPGSSVSEIRDLPAVSESEIGNSFGTR
jgi:acylphosphatase